MNEGAALRVLSFLNDTSERHLASLANEKRKVAMIGEEHEPEEIQGEEPLSADAIDEDDTLLNPEQVKDFFKATEEGSIERLDELFDATANSNPNMTQYTESLLMAAIRAKRHKVAEYLIDQLAVNVNHTAELMEFRTQTNIPVRQHTLSCRELAYNKGMMDLVDLIDIASDEVKPSVKRYLQRRLKSRLDEIHQAYLKRLKDRNNRFIIQTQENDKKIIEDDEEEKENERSSTINIADNINLPQPPAQVVHRAYKSHIEKTIKSIEALNDKSIDETGKKRFRFSGYTLRYRLVETTNTTKQSRPKTSPFSLPIIPSTTSRQSPPTPPLLSRPTTTATTQNMHRRSISDISTHIPIRETRTSICRSARLITTPRVIPTVNNIESRPLEIKPTTNITQRLLPRRAHQTYANHGYIPQQQHALYNEPHHFMPVTLKATAIGLPSTIKFIRD